MNFEETHRVLRSIEVDIGVGKAILEQNQELEEDVAYVIHIRSLLRLSLYRLDEAITEDLGVDAPSSEEL